MIWLTFGSVFVDDEDESDADTIETLTYASYSPRRVANPKLPDTVTFLETPGGGKVYVVGTAHFSKESQEDVAKVSHIPYILPNKCPHENWF